MLNTLKFCIIRIIYKEVKSEEEMEGYQSVVGNLIASIILLCFIVY